MKTMRALLLLLSASVLGAAPLAQDVEWESLDGPYSGSGGILVGDPEGMIYRPVNRDGVGEVWRSADGVTWEPTAYPGSPVRSLRTGADGSLVVAAAAGVFVGSNGGDTWLDAGLVGEDVRIVARDEQGRTYALLGQWPGCVIMGSTDDGASWLEVNTSGAPFHCGRDITTALGGWLVVLGPRDPYDFPTVVFASHNLGASWHSTSPGGIINRFVRGQHGETFAIANRLVGMFGPSYPPYLHRWYYGTWQQLTTDAVTGVTTRPDGSVLIGFADGRISGMDDLGVASPWHIVETADGTLVVSTAGAGRWRHSAEDGWRQVAGAFTEIRTLTAHLGAPYAGFGANVLRHDGERWRPTGWTRNRADALAFYDDELWVATAGWYWGNRDEPRESRWFVPPMGVWKADSSVAFEIAKECNWGHCAAPAVVAADGIALASHILSDYFDVFDVGEGVVRSTDGGQTWQSVIPGSADICLLAGTPRRGFVAARGSCFGYGNSSESFYRSLDGGLTWTAHTEGLPADWAQAVAVGTDRTSYLALKGEGVFRLGNDLVWHPMGPQGTEFPSIAVNSEGQVAAAVDGHLRVFDGLNWTWPPTPAGGVHRVHFDHHDVLLIATDEGIHRSLEPFVVQSESSAAPRRTALQSIHPNPTSGAVMVAFTLEAPGDATLTLYDLLGRRVAVLADGVYSAGSHEARFSAAGLAAGVYVVELRAEDSRWARRVSILGP